MDWLINLFMGNGVGHSIMIISLVITVGILLGKFSIRGISLGSTWILFMGILFSHFGLKMDPGSLHFLKEFGLILFVFSVGLQMGPGFFSSFKKGGMSLNLMALFVVILGILTTWIIQIISGEDMASMVGVMSGAITNTPGLGAAQQAFIENNGINNNSIAMGYAVAYPLGVVGIIMSIIIFKNIFRIDMTKEAEQVDSLNKNDDKAAELISVKVTNPGVYGKTIYEIVKFINKKFVVSRILHNEDEIEMGSPKIKIQEGDKLFVVTSAEDVDSIVAFIGERIDMDYEEWQKFDTGLVSKRIVVTKPSLNGKTLGFLNLRNSFGVNVTRVNRVGLDLVANPSLALQVGDRVVAVGSKSAIANVTKLLGNSSINLKKPHLVAIFTGIALGIILGSIPVVFPGMPQPVKLGLAGGPLIIAILMGRFGSHFKIVTYSTVSANLMLREIGISLFLACVGLGAGEGFVDTIINKGGYMWILYGFIITVVPLLIVGFISKLVYKTDFFSLMGLIAGSTTDPVALQYANNLAGNDRPSIAYATVYPLTMFLRVLAAQIMILFLL